MGLFKHSKNFLFIWRGPYNLFKKRRAITPTLNEFEGSQTYK
jgi:hypothetical protein